MYTVLGWPDSNHIMVNEDYLKKCIPASVHDDKIEDPAYLVPIEIVDELFPEEKALP